MYRIIASDGKEYGPVTADQLRQWITEGRVNGQTQVQAQGSVDWQPLSAFPEFAAVLPPPPTIGTPPSSPPAIGPAAALSNEEVLARDYSIDIGHCISRGWDLVMQNFWPVVGTSLLVMVCMSAVNQILGIFSTPAVRHIWEAHTASLGDGLAIFGVSILGAPVQAIFMGGLFKYYLKLIRGEPARLEDAFSGFSAAPGQLLLLGLVSGLFTIIGYVLCILPGLYLVVAWTFAIPLVMDRQLAFWDAMELSRKVITRHWFVFFGLVLVAGLVAALGFLALCVGIFVSMPVCWAAILYAYEDLFGRPAA